MELISSAPKSVVYDVARLVYGKKRGAGKTLMDGVAESGAVIEEPFDKYVVKPTNQTLNEEDDSDDK